jgi:hypothetical protein
MQSTLGAPLSLEEERAILTAWARCVAAGHDLAPGTRDPVAMLDRATEMVAAAQDLRSAIDRAWHLANRRRWPAGGTSGPRIRRRQPKAVLSTAQALAHLGLTEADLDAILNRTSGPGVTHND